MGRNTGMQLLVHLLDDRRWDTSDVKMLTEANEILVLEILDRPPRSPHQTQPPTDGGGLLGRLGIRRIPRRPR